MTTPTIAILAFLVLLLVLLAAAIRILREYERGVVFTLGRFTGVKGPGLILLIPFIQQDGAHRPAYAGARCSQPGRDLA